MKKTDARKEVQARLLELSEKPYGEFTAKLVPNVPADCILGVRMPILRKYGKEIENTATADFFLADLPHRYHEENNLHAVLIAGMKDYGRIVEELGHFLPYVNNWATCDTLNPKVFAHHREELLPEIEKWIASKETFTIRFSIDMLMGYYLEDDSFDAKYPEMVAQVSSEEYYVNMMRAWYFATALAKQYEAVLPYLTENRLDPWTHARTIQKAVESYRITPEQKAYLKSLRRAS